MRSPPLRARSVAVVTLSPIAAIAAGSSTRVGISHATEIHDNRPTGLDPSDAWRHSAAMRFRLGSVPVQVQAGFFVVSAMLGWRGETADVAIWIAVCFVSILVHEMGHALAIARFGGT